MYSRTQPLIHVPLFMPSEEEAGQVAITKKNPLRVVSHGKVKHFLKICHFQMYFLWRCFYSTLSFGQELIPEVLVDNFVCIYTYIYIYILYIYGSSSRHFKLADANLFEESVDCCTYPPRKLTWQWNIQHLKTYFLLNMGIFQCDFSFQGCRLLYVSTWTFILFVSNGFCDQLHDFGLKTAIRNSKWTLRKECKISSNGQWNNISSGKSCPFSGAKLTDGNPMVTCWQFLQSNCRVEDFMMEKKHRQPVFQAHRFIVSIDAGLTKNASVSVTSTPCDSTQVFPQVEEKL